MVRYTPDNFEDSVDDYGSQATIGQMAINRTVNSKDATEDGVLVRTILNGDTSAYAVLYDRYAQLVRAKCYDTTRNITETADLSQEVFLRAFRKLGDLRHPERYGAWLVAITRTACQDWRRTRARDKHRHMNPEDVSATAPIAPDNNSVDRCIHEALLQLPEKERLAIQAFYLLDESTERAQAILNLSRSGLYRVLRRARNRLKHLLRDYWEDLP